uniref:Uncharacterized protein n=1 Tax=Mus musculus TaxID=10090 RepID=Q9D8D5_MOUSE|nr:unnamed protein product [Mus musculus]
MLGNTCLLALKDTERSMCVWCVSSSGSRRGKAASCLQKVHASYPRGVTNAASARRLCRGVGNERSQRASVRARRPLLSAKFLPITPTWICEDVLLRSKDSKSKGARRGHEAHASPGMEHVCIIYLLEFYVFM